MAAVFPIAAKRRVVRIVRRNRGLKIRATTIYDASFRDSCLPADGVRRMFEDLGWYAEFVEKVFRSP